MNQITTDMRIRAAFSGGERIEHIDPRERLLMLYGVWVKCLPHQAGRRRLIEIAIARCKDAIAERVSGYDHLAVVDALEAMGVMPSDLTALRGAR